MIELDYTNIQNERIGDQHGIPAEAIESAAKTLQQTVNRVEEERSVGRLGFADLPTKEGVIEAICEFSATASFPNVLLIGIGGSALGAIALHAALSRNNNSQKLFALDNLDPDFIHDTLDSLEPRDVIVTVIAKSGMTTETMAIFTIVRRWMIDHLGEQRSRSHFVVVTDTGEGDLLSISRQEKYQTFGIPSNVGGRFSVLTPVGLVPAALLGFDIHALLKGANKASLVARRPPDQNPALLMGFIQWFLERNRGKSILTLFPYCQSLWKFAFWYKQLWGESLGKKKNRQGEIVHLGQTPTAALGVTDQHSQLQLFIEGPNDKSFVFWEVRNPRNEIEIDSDLSSYPSLAYLKGRKIGEVFHVEKEATEIALTEAARPNITISIDRLDEESLGELIMFSEYATVYAGELYDINAFDQPGVDYGKHLTFSILGRTGFSKYEESIAKYRRETRMVIR